MNLYTIKKTYPVGTQFTSYLFRTITIISYENYPPVGIIVNVTVKGTAASHRSGYYTLSNFLYSIHHIWKRKDTK